MAMLGLPNGINACLFDLDGVLTDTASVHMKAWKEMFDAFLSSRGQPEFTQQDYDDYVDGKPRADGVRDFLASRGVQLADGMPDDSAEAATVQGLGNRKNQLVLERIHRDGVLVYEGSRRYLELARDAGLRRAVVSSSANTKEVLQVTGLDKLVEARIDGGDLATEHLRGKPAPDSYWAAAARLAVVAEKAAVFEDATAGVQAGRDGRFGYVVGINRLDDAHAQALREHGADVVVTDLVELIRTPGDGG
jgi:beta-phosphoglucomutase family hydrolase